MVELKPGAVVTYDEFERMGGIKIDIQQIWESIDPTSAKVDYVPMYLSLVREKKELVRGKPVAIGGRGPIWLYAIVLHELHGISPIVMVEDPKVGGYVIIYSHIATSEILRKAEATARQFIQKTTLVNVDGVREILLETFKKLVEIEEKQTKMYEEYLSLKKKQVELLEKSTDNRTRYD